MTGSDPGVYYCRHCRRALNIRTSPHGFTFLHATELRGAQADHRADPVPLTDLDNPEMECDFCAAPDPTWVYEGDDQRTERPQITGSVVSLDDYRARGGAARTLRVETAPGITQSFGHRWAACNLCADLIDHRDLLGLIGRVVDSLPAKTVRGNRLARVRGELHTMYSNLFATLTPMRGRITPQHPLGLWEPIDPPPART